MKSLNYFDLPSAAIASGATTPVPADGAGSLVYSTTAGAPLVWNGSQWASCASGGGTGDVVGPASATDNRVVRFDGTTGKLVQSSIASISDTGDFAIGNDGVNNGRVLAYSATGSHLAMTFTDGTNAGLLNIAPNGTTAHYLQANNGSHQLYMQGSNIYLAFLYDGSEKFRFTYDGKLLIGTTTSSSALLTVNGAAEATTIELGHATDTTLARAAAGRVTVEGAPLVRGPSVAPADNEIVRFDGTTGDLIQDCAATINDDGVIRSATNTNLH